jgi:hypothetical protein
LQREKLERKKAQDNADYEDIAIMTTAVAAAVNPIVAAGLLIGGIGYSLKSAYDTRKQYKKSKKKIHKQKLNRRSKQHTMKQ